MHGGGCIYAQLLVKLSLDLIIVRRGFLNFHRRTRVKLKVRANTSNMNILEDGKDISKVETLPSVHHTTSNKKNIKNVRRCKDSRSAKSRETR